LNLLGVIPVNDTTAHVAGEVTTDMDPEDEGAPALTADSDMPDGQRSAPAVQAMPSSSVELAPGCFVVPSKNASMYGKKMRDIHIAGFTLESNATIRFRKSNGKVVVADLLVAIGRYSRTDSAQHAIVKLINRSDEIVQHLNSIEVDKSLIDKVSAYFLNQQI